MFLSSGCSLLRAEGFSCSLGVHYGGLGISELQFWSKIIIFFSCIFPLNFWSSKPWIRNRIRIHGFRIAIQWRRGEPVTPRSQHFFGFKLGSSVADPHWFQCGSGYESGSSIFRQCGPGSRTSYRRSLHPSATLQNLNYLHFCGPVWPSWIRIRIRIPNADPDPYSQCGSGSSRPKWMRIRADLDPDPDPQHCLGGMVLYHK
jgi:hypothetical protein